jgi:hemerythrin-like domain-containing protein
MYRPHAAREDTVIFPAWKNVLSAKQYDEMNDKFEDIEKEMFGKDGFENSVLQMSEIETALGLADLAQFTPAKPMGK